ncbi:MAG: hypothetical protein ACU0DW_12560 [Shimia sp.]
MKTGTIIAAIAAVIAIALGIYLIDIDQTQQAELPEVNVEGGQLPEYDVETGEVVVGTTETEVEVPDVNIDVETVTREVDVPTIGLEAPEEDAVETAENE